MYIKKNIKKYKRKNIKIYKTSYKKDYKKLLYKTMIYFW